MSSVRRNAAGSAASPSAAPAGECEAEHEWFYADLADGLHAMAQPLTILRSAIAMLSLSSEAEMPRHRCLDISVRQIDRACGLFESLQNLVFSKLEPATPVSMDLWGLLPRIIEDQAPALQELGVAIVAMNSVSLPPIWGDPHRTEQAISAVFKIVQSISSRGDTFEISASQSGDFVELAITGTQNHPRSLNSSERLYIAVAKANTMSQQGRCHFADEPFCVTIALPVCQPKPQRDEALIACTSS